MYNQIVIFLAAFMIVVYILFKYGIRISKVKLLPEYTQPATSGSVIATVYDPNGALAPAGTEVTMTYSNNNPMGSQTTDSNGKVTFSYSVEGTFTLAASGYGTITQEFKFGVVPVEVTIGTPRVFSLIKKQKFLFLKNVKMEYLKMGIIPNLL